MNYKVALLLPYFGELHNYFDLWMLSAECNKKFDFFVFTDDRRAKRFKPSSNIHIVFMEFNEVKEKISYILEYGFVLHRPYKINDYRVLFGLIFEKYIREYDFWGYCDCDLIWGDMEKYITDEILKDYDRIYQNGHLSIYRNNERVNRAVLQDVDVGRITQKDVFTSKYSAHFDESPLLKRYLDMAGTRQYFKPDFADPSFFKKQFVIGNEEKIAYFEYNEGNLYGYIWNGDITGKREYLYVHLQKREMVKNIDPCSHFYIVPNEFISELGDHNIQGSVAPSKIYGWKMVFQNRKRQVQNVLDGALQFRIKGGLK